MWVDRCLLCGEIAAVCCVGRPLSVVWRDRCCLLCGETVVCCVGRPLSVVMGRGDYCLLRWETIVCRDWEAIDCCDCLLQWGIRCFHIETSLLRWESDREAKNLCCNEEAIFCYDGETVVCCDGETIVVIGKPLSAVLGNHCCYWETVVCCHGDMACAFKFTQQPCRVTQFTSADHSQGVT